MLAVAVSALLPGGEQARLHSKGRKQWKESALKSILVQGTNSQWITNEIAKLRLEAAQDPEGGWVGTNLLVMTNGEWLLYQNNCVKEPSHLHDLFLARGSDGKWYYSTFHFCIGMVVLRMGGATEEPGAPGSLAEFVKTYAVREFDGKSDVCLEKTWPIKGGGRNTTD